MKVISNHHPTYPSLWGEVCPRRNPIIRFRSSRPGALLNLNPLPRPVIREVKCRSHALRGPTRSIRFLCWLLDSRRNVTGHHTLLCKKTICDWRYAIADLRSGNRSEIVYRKSEIAYQYLYFRNSQLGLLSYFLDLTKKLFTKWLQVLIECQQPGYQ